MGEVLGLGLSHAGMFVYPDAEMVNILKRELARPSTPPALREVKNWPRPMQEEWADDEGLNAARRHREIVVNGFRQLREELDSFNPDFVLIWGDDQYENFREDVVPPFCVYAYDEAECRPYRSGGPFNRTRNIWGHADDAVVPVAGHREAATYLVEQLLHRDFDVAYAFKPHHHPGLAHAFINTVLYLDYDQQGFDYPIIPFHVNCYGSDLLRNRREPGEAFARIPPSPTPRRCFDLGWAVADAIEQSPWRAAVIGSSSWSHAFLTRKHYGLYPDIEADRSRLAQLRDGRQGEWRDLTLDALVDAGQHEFLNWVCLAGAMADRKPEVLAYAETWVLNSDKAAALFRP
jgi:hypothetical protein